MGRRRWLLWLLLSVGLVFGNCQVIPESRSPETLISTLIPTLAPTPTTTSTLESPITTLILTPTPILTDTVSRTELDLTSVIGSILSNPADYADQEVTIVGYYRGWDLLGEAGTGPPVTRSDWVITDSSGAIYVEARGGFDRALGLDPSSRDDTTEVLRLVGVVRVNDRGQPYIEPQKLETMTSPTAIPSAGVEPEMLLAKVTIEAVELRYLESLPIQIELFIKGNLPDECEYELVATQAREGQMISVTLEGRRPADLPCAAAIRPIVTYALLLEGGFEPGDYTLVVNDYQMSFSVPVSE